MSQQTLADRAGIPRNQIVRAERGENITIDTLRKIAAHLPLNELTLMDTTTFRVDIIAEPEKLFQAAMENVLRLVDALAAALRLAGEANTAVEVARRSMNPPPPPMRADGDPVFFLRGLERLSHQVEELAKEAKIAS